MPSDPTIRDLPDDLFNVLADAGRDAGLSRVGWERTLAAVADARRAAQPKPKRKTKRKTEVEINEEPDESGE